jgi:hypothetical protein
MKIPKPVIIRNFRQSRDYSRNTKGVFNAAERGLEGQPSNGYICESILSNSRQYSANVKNPHVSTKFLCRDPTDIAGHRKLTDKREKYASEIIRLTKLTRIETSQMKRKLAFWTGSLQKLLTSTAI